ncbi:MAG: peptidylprolyl isomerase [Candidatus Aenigmarchaeota archaeon]|nr:peptidylprolyl isomerase [Candidatus Aenigmarchaeota archaeon]
MQKGDFVRINYTGRLESGEIFDITDSDAARKEGVFSEKARYGPMPVIIGANMLIPGLDKAIEGMNVGDKKDTEIEPEDAFGQRNSNLVKTVSKNVFKEHEPHPGMIVDFGSMRGRIQSISGGRVRVDFNNPLAGKKLFYHIEVVEKIDGAENKIRAVLDFFDVKSDIKLGEKEAEINAKLPAKMKETLSDMIIRHVEGIERVKFIETYGKK